MKSVLEVADWCVGAAREFGDPATVVCQLFFQWREDLQSVSGDDIVCGMHDGHLLVLLGPEFPALPIPIEVGPPKIDADEQLVTYGLEQIAAGVWAVSPSLNVEGLIHGFVVLYDVPSPAPWERRIIVAAA